MSGSRVGHGHVKDGHLQKGPTCCFRQKFFQSFHHNILILMSVDNLAFLYGIWSCNPFTRQEKCIKSILYRQRALPTVELKGPACIVIFSNGDKMISTCSYTTYAITRRILRYFVKV